MSRWTYIESEFLCTGDEDALRTLFAQDDIPRGINTSTDIDVYIDRSTVYVYGALRDFGWDADFAAVQVWIRRLIDSGIVQQGYVQCLVADRFVVGWYYINGILTEVRIPDGFINTMDED